MKFLVINIFVGVCILAYCSSDSPNKREEDIIIGRNGPSVSINIMDDSSDTNMDEIKVAICMQLKLRDSSKAPEFPNIRVLNSKTGVDITQDFNIITTFYTCLTPNKLISFYRVKREYVGKNPISKVVQGTGTMKVEPHSLPVSKYSWRRLVPDKVARYTRKTTAKITEITYREYLKWNTRILYNTGQTSVLSTCEVDKWIFNTYDMHGELYQEYNFSPAK